MTDRASQGNDNNILHAIKTSKARMRPRWYFIVQSILTAVVLALLFFLVLLLVSFIVFAVQQNGSVSGMSFGLTGWEIFFRSIPWSVLLLSLALLLVLLLLLRRYPFFYQRPSLYLLVSVIIVVALGSVCIIIANVHERIEDNNIPLLNSFYQYEAAPAYYMYRGTIIQSTTQGFILENAIGQTSTVRVSPAGFNFVVFPTGTYVLIFGAPDPMSSATIDLFGIERGRSLSSG